MELEGKSVNMALIAAVAFFFASSVNAKIVKEYIPGNNCGLGQAIVTLDREPTAAERAAGCIYVEKFVPNSMDRKWNILRRGRSLFKALLTCSCSH